MPLTDLNLLPAYDPDTCPDLVANFYSPALAQSVAYDRATFTFSAQGLAAAAVGLAGLLRNHGQVRILCEPRELSAETRQAILDGHEQALVQAFPPATLTHIAAADLQAKNQLDLLTWLVAQGRLEIKVAIAKDADGGIFHAKTGLMTDAAGNSISFDGSPNETAAGWQRNYERFHVFRSWQESDHVAQDAAHFNRLWHNQTASRWQFIPLPDAYRQQLIAAAPAVNPAGPPPAAPSERDAYWQRIRDALQRDPANTLTTIPARLWPHQAAFFRQHAGPADPVRLLLADEVGLGKTIQAGSLLKAGLNQGQISRFLILAPRAALPQWQEELQNKFNLSLPRLETDGPRSLLYPDGRRRPAPDPPWAAPALLMSYQWLRRHKDDFLAAGLQYDLVIVDEAHRARFTEVTNPNRRQPNQYLRLLQSLSRQTQSLLLLTATPMQLHAAELHALLELLQPTKWSVDEFQRFYDAAAAPTWETWQFMRDLYRRLYPHSSAPEERRLYDGNTGYLRRFLDREPQRLQDDLRRMRERSPAKRRLSRHTRETLRRYARQGLIDAVVPHRRVRPEVIQMTPEERSLYAGIDELVSAVYGGAPGVNATALGFVMTTYRKRLGSSPRAYALSGRRPLESRPSPAAAWRELARREEDELEDAADADGELPTAPLTLPARALLDAAILAARRLESRDSKLRRLRAELQTLTAAGHRKILIFTQFKDTLNYLRASLAANGWANIVCLYGQDESIEGSRAGRLRDLRAAKTGLLICTETASESLNLQFCSAMVNYDIPWNPMTLEQRIGRIDRIGQERPEVDILNLFYENTAEWDAYKAMGERLRDIHGHVGEYQPILYDPTIANRLPAIIRANGKSADTQAAVRNLTSELPFDLDSLTRPLEIPPPADPAITMADLRRALTAPGLLPAGWQVRPAGGPYWQLARPDGEVQTVTTDFAAYEYALGEVAWFGPGSAWWPG